MSVDFAAHYTVEGYDGIAWYLRGHPVVRPECEGHYNDDHALLTEGIGEGYFCDGSCQGEYEDQDRVIATMVGDDRRFEFGVDEIAVIPDDSYCRDCGQIGCGHNVYD